MPRLNVMIVNEGLPYPATAGNRIRTLNLMLRLAKRHNITYLCRGPGTTEDVRTAAEYLADHGSIQTIVIDDPIPKKTGAIFYARLLSNLKSTVPYAVESHNSPAIRRAVIARAAKGDIDLWQFEWFPYAEALQGYTGAPKIIMAHNVETLIWQRYYETEKNPLRRWYIKKQWQKYENYERHVMSQATRVITVSPDDAEIVRMEFGLRHVDVVDNGIDGEYFAQATGERNPNQILFLGSLDWRPNIDAVQILLNQIFPEVLKQQPSAILAIVGRKPPEWLVRKVQNMAQVKLHADVADVRPFLAQSAVMAVPLRIGGGSRLKILEAAACGLPVVSTRVGCEGLVLLPDQHLHVVDQTEELARALLETLRAPQVAQDMAKRARELVLKRYDWDVLADRLEHIWLQSLQKGEVLQEV